MLRTYYVLARSCKNIIGNKTPFCYFLSVTTPRKLTLEPENHPVKKGNYNLKHPSFIWVPCWFFGGCTHWNPVESNSATPTSHSRSLFFSAHRRRLMFSKNPAPCVFLIDFCSFWVQENGFGESNPQVMIWMNTHVSYEKRPGFRSPYQQHPSHEFLLWRFVFVCFWRLRLWVGGVQHTQQCLANTAEC